METIPYTYDSTWKDKLTSYGGVTIQSDALGNVTNDGVWSYTWEGGRRLAGMSKSGTSVSFKYDENGQRIKKVVNGVTTEYTVQGKRVVHVKNSTLGEMHIYYDGNRPDMVLYNGAIYRYVHSLQGDILGLQDGTGSFVVEYCYDAWGRQISKTGSLANSLGTLNPFRYRGYVYDEETGLYYLRSRYYNPNWCRFISSDSLVSTGQGILGNNMFAYCLNNPVVHADYSGTDAIVLFDKDWLGHIGIMVQDDEGTWWHYYWGTKDVKEGGADRIICAFKISVEPYSWCVSFNGDASSLSDINGSNQYSGDYEIMHYFPGDFTEAIPYMQNYSEMYNLYTNNCGQVSLRILASANEDYYTLLIGAAEFMLPARANGYIANNK